MPYSTEDMAKALKSARANKGLSQHDLAKLVGMPQSHLSKIESGAVDLRLSSLVELARALDLEVTLVPQKNLSAVNSIVRHGSSGRFVESDTSAAKELMRVRQTLSRVARKHPDLKQVAQVQRRVNDMAHFQMPHVYGKRLGEVRRALDAFYRGGNNHPGLKMALHEIEELRNELAHSANIDRMPGRARPLYSLEDDDHG